MAYCPNCRASVELNAPTCKACCALFAADGWSPADAPTEPAKRSPAAAVIVKLGVATVLLPVVGFLIGLFLSSVIPGCHCDGSAGCQGCGLNGLISFLLFGGFAGALGALIVALPTSLVLALVVGAVSKRCA